jgi:signal transduction histidine kinase/DNA-binding response OmpR family regulator
LYSNAYPCRVDVRESALSNSLRDPGALSLFDGGGELGDRMRALDWSRTALGPVEQWPQSLKTCVRIVLTSRQPMFVWWGEELINLYNDAYKSIVGGKHPAALGQPASVVWREIWDQVGPRAERAMRHDQGTYDEALLLIMERHGYQEETYYTFSYSPVSNEHGGTGGILCANTDDTRRIIGERRLAVLREIAARTADARRPEDTCVAAAAALETGSRDVPFALIYLADPGSDSLALAGTAGISPGHPVAPRRIGAGDSSPWPAAEALRDHTERIVDNLAALGTKLPTGAWDQPPSRAVVWPLSPSGQAGRAGVLVLGLNPFRPLDDDYRSFLSLVAGQISAGISNAQAYENERLRAEALAEIDRAKTVFFSNVSHEFRTPLTLMLAPQEDALASPDGALAGESLRAVHRNTLRLLRLVNNLLDFSRIEAGRAKARYEPTDLAMLTADLASAFRSAIERGELRFEVDCPPLPEPAYVDRTLWETIVLNLISNAFKFTMKGSIRVELRERAGRAELKVIDTGIGIPERELPRMFERFHRVEVAEARTYEGSGIGLALVKELVQLHGGEIRVDSREGAGTTFTVSIPLGRAHLPAERVASGVQPRDGGSVARAEPFVQEALRWIGDPEPEREPSRPAAEAEPRARVLVADDNADMREYLARLLGEHWEVETAPDGARALELARARRPDLIVSDAMMPKLDGFALLAEVRRDPTLQQLPVILLSARAGEESRVEGIEAGADDYLVKPFTAKELLARVRSHLESASGRRAAEVERQRLRMLLGELPAIVNFLRGPDLVIEYAHPMTVAALGGRELAGKPLLEAIPEFRDQEYPKLLRRVLETGERIEGHEKLVKIADGQGNLRDTFWSFVYLPLRGEGGRVEGVMTFDLEVTEPVLARRQVEEQSAQLARATEEAQAARAVAETANRAKDEFLAMLGHELRNPLSPILTALQLMRMRSGETREQAVIERQVGHLVRLVDDLLDISRITRGKIELRRQPIELASAVAAGLEMARPLLEQRRQHLDLNVPPEGLLLQADPNRLAQVVSNLLTNASKYSDHGSTIHLTARREGSRLRLSVRDEGVGLPPDLLDRVFEIFFQQPQSMDRSKGGLGLGLAIVRSLVEMHGGRVSAHSDGLGKGSDFVVDLPALPAAEDLRNPPPALLSSDLTGRGAKDERKRVLVVDDNTDAADMLVDLLADLGYTAKATYDAASALAQAPAFQPDICLLDIGLPVMDGYELASRLRHGPTDGVLRLVAVTGYGQDADRARAREAGFDAHLVKPVSLDALEQALSGA